jgi:hypothetical protein
MRDHSKIRRDIYRQLYLEATPSADFDDLIESGEDGFFSKYYLAQERQDEIVREHCKGMRAWERRMIEVSVTLGCSPRGTKKVKS